jgi:hypothetical protein
VHAHWEEAQKVQRDSIARAREYWVKLAIQNCPLIFTTSEWPGRHNIAYSPCIGRRIHWLSKALGGLCHSTV